MLRSTYLEFYCSEIAPALRDIDILIKSGESPIPVREVSRVLRAAPGEVERIAAEHGVECIGRSDFFMIMGQCRSEVCRMYCREVEVGSPVVYTVDDAAYIYGVDRSVVAAACEELGVKEITAWTLPEVLGAIRIEAVRWVT